jgi:CheY-like chemotaxis protein
MEARVSRRSLLLVDDSPELGVIVAALGKRPARGVPYDTECQADVAGAWRYLQDHRPDLILLDVNLPGVSGLELCRRLRAAPEPERFVIALFCHEALSSDIAAGLEAGVDFLMPKELVSRPAQWHRRLSEILLSPYSQRRGRSLGWGTGILPRPVPHWVDGVNGALGHPSLRQVGSEVLAVILRRALAQAFAQQARFPCLLDGNEARLIADSVPFSDQPEIVVGFVVALAEQMWCVLGTEASAAFRTALSEVVPGICERLSP